MRTDPGRKRREGVAGELLCGRGFFGKLAVTRDNKLEQDSDDDLRERKDVRNQMDSLSTHPKWRRRHVSCINVGWRLL
jgi:hypothetical protein